MNFLLGKKSLEELVKKSVKEAWERIERAATDTVSMSVEIGQLKKDLTNKQIEWDREKEKWDRKEREVEHKVGLELKRHEFEIEAAKKEAVLSVREENLRADKERFKQEMDFQRERLEGEVKSLREMVGQMLERLPSAEIFASIGAQKAGKK